jgi:hypothetical protein
VVEPLIARRLNSDFSGFAVIFGFLRHFDAFA